MGVIGFVLFVGLTHDGDVTAAWAEAEATRSAVHREQVASWRECREANVQYSDEICGNRPPDSAEASAFFEDPRYLPAQSWRQNIHVYGLLLVLSTYLLAALSVGGDWNKNVFVGLTMLEPRRTRLYLARTLCVTGATAVLGATLAVVLVGGLASAALLNGSWDGWTTSDGMGASALLARACAAGIVAALLGAFLGHLLRSTVGALVTTVLVLSVVENVIRSLHVEWSRWLITENLLALLRTDGIDVPGEARWLPDGSLIHETITITPGDALVLLMTYTLLLGTLAWASFSRRDVV